MSTQKLEPCPFCGALTNFYGTAHTDDCYFMLRRRLDNAPDGDLSMVQTVIDAWNRRSPSPTQKEAASVEGGSDSDEQIEALIEDSGGYWKEDVFCIGGPELMNLLRTAAASPSLRLDEQREAIATGVGASGDGQPVAAWWAQCRENAYWSGSIVGLSWDELWPEAQAALTTLHAAARGVIGCPPTPDKGVTDAG